MKRITRTLLSVMFISAAAMFSAAQASAQQIECEGIATKVKSVTLPNYHNITAWFPGGQLQTVLSTTVTVEGKGRSCLVVDFSAMARPNDNWIVFQVRVDGVPMEGHLGSFSDQLIPVVATVEETDLNYPRPVAYNFFAVVGPGEHTVELLTAAGGGLPNPDLPVQPLIGSPVLTIKYR